MENTWGKLRKTSEETRSFSVDRLILDTCNVIDTKDGKPTCEKISPYFSQKMQQRRWSSESKGSYLLKLKKPSNWIQNSLRQKWMEVTFQCLVLSVILTNYRACYITLSGWLLFLLWWRIRVAILLVELFFRYFRRFWHVLSCLISKRCLFLLYSVYARYVV